MRGRRGHRLAWGGRGRARAKIAVGVVRGPARYRITLQRVYATDEAISDGLRFHELRQFSLVIAKPDTMVVFSGCEWERLTERAEVGSSVLEEAVVLAAVRGEYEQQEG